MPWSRFDLFANHLNKKNKLASQDILIMISFQDLVTGTVLDALP
jgi:hypothetical protein